MRLIRLLHLAASVFVVVMPESARAQHASARALTDSVRVSIDAATRAGSVARLDEARRLVTRARAAFPDDGLLLHYEGFLRYRLITVAGATLSSRDVMRTLDEARVALEHSVARRPMAESYLLLSEIYGRQVVADPSRGGALGKPQALARARAMSMGASNPRIFLLAGIAALYAPRESGGGVEVAERLLRASLALFEHDPARPPDPTWGHAEAYAWLGQVHQRSGRKADAAASYRRALALEPDNAWVREVLVPGAR